MNMAFVNSTRKWGGVKTWMLEVAHALKGRGHGVFVYGRQQAFVDAARERLGHGDRVSFGPDLNPFAVAQFIEKFRQHNIDAVFINVEKDLATAGVAAKCLGIPVIQRVGMPDDIPYRFKTAQLHKIINPFFFCPCQYIADGLLRALPYVQPDRTCTLITSKNVSGHELAAHTPRQLIMTQQLNRDKGHAVIFEALSKIHSPFVLHVVGTGYFERELKNLASEFGLDDRIRWHGFSTDVGKLLKESDIFILASLAEGLPNTLLEALAHGLLPIVRNVGGVSEVMTTPLTPWVLPEHATAEDFRECLEKSLSLDESELLKVRGQAREACEEHCHVERMITRLESWLSYVVAGPS